MQKDAFIKSGIKENEDEKERELIKKIKRKKYNRSVSNEKNEIVKSSKKYYCSGFNMYKDIISKSITFSNYNQDKFYLNKLKFKKWKTRQK